MSTLSVLYKTRRVLDDFGEVFSSEMEGDGVSTVYELDVSQVDNVVVSTQPTGGGPITTLTPAVVGGAPNDYTVDGYNGIVQLTSPIDDQTLLIVTGYSYQFFTDLDLTDYVLQAFAMHTDTRNPPVYLDPVPQSTPPTLILPVVEERAVALLGAKLVMDDMATAAAKGITIDTGDGTVIPRGQRYQQYTAEAQRLWGDYSEMVNRLGLQGYAGISVTNLRRESYATARLVPLYVPREWDDRLFPQRVLPPIPEGLPGTQGQVITEKGQWKPLVNYAVNDVVWIAGTEYLCLVANQGVNPATDIAAGDGFYGQYWEKTYINSGMAGFYGPEPW